MDTETQISLASFVIRSALAARRDHLIRRGEPPSLVRIPIEFATALDAYMNAFAGQPDIVSVDRLLGMTIEWLDGPVVTVST